MLYTHSSVLVFFFCLQTTKNAFSFVSPRLFFCRFRSASLQKFAYSPIFVISFRFFLFVLFSNIDESRRKATHRSDPRKNVTLRPTFWEGRSVADQDMLSVLTAQAPSPCSAAQHIRAHISLCSFSLRIRISFFIIIFFNYELAFCYCLRIVLFCLFSSFFLFVFFSHQPWLFFYNKPALRSAANQHKLVSLFLSFCARARNTRQRNNT